MFRDPEVLAGLPDVDVRIAGEHREHVAAQAGEHFRITKHVGHRHRQARNHVGNALVTMQDALSQLADIGEAEVIDQRLHATLERGTRSEEHTSELQSLMRISYAVFCLKKKTKT